MIDFTHARTTMVDTQVRPSDVTRYQVIEAMLAVPRELFVPHALRSVAYAGEDIELDGGRVVMAPRTLAKMMNALDPSPGELILDVACGTGYAAALVGRTAGGVVALESLPDLATAAEAALAEAGAETVAVVRGPLEAGWPGQAPYDAILVSGGAVEELPDSLTAQLREGGRIVALFREGALGTARLGLATPTGISWFDLFNANAPPLREFTRRPAFVL